MDKLEEVEELELSSNKNDETTENSEDKNVNEVTLKQDNVIEEIKDGEKEDSEALEKEDTAEEHTATVLEMDRPLEDSTKSDIEEPKTKKDKLHKYTIAITIISIILFIGLVIFSTAFALANKFSDKIVSGISISSIDVSGLTYDEAKENIKNGTQKVIERAKNGWNRFKDNEGKEIKEKTSEWFDKYFPEEY